MQSESNLLWIDLEMTGLDEEIHHIIEIASIITDKDLNLLAEGPNLAIYQPQEILDLMDDWCQTTHGNSGLVKRIMESDVTVLDAMNETIEFASQWIPAGKSPLCGNSIGTDRRFLKKYMPALDQFCHYRNIDVSSFKEVVNRWYPNPLTYEKKNTHLALDDIRESINELKFIREHYFIK
ncbi:oligoribonuclease [Ignatzschineria cameli]|uniref:Oligoribonuclease n=1 Tax=Ignatzschineria cameli TaxID=2182793 RepID=A0A2U2AS53_9GAMM|nr:oligoribonuclease [Ignatzschineria cameli]PWD86650.1 oligoribonuclease [Ignatzschineria cameli]PWD86997.1 oligoribonuclease [Ignatzschineria cameli]PWD91970.1 oligoribonuclease [Ignatzschineria cameli]PWD93444.1 oligoribonuclease [Ignatzschineria cameli]PWD94186.1 oligoribonuclease [Ignatzschineria cameli]